MLIGNLRQTITTTTCRQPDIWLMCEMFADSGAFEYRRWRSQLGCKVLHAVYDTFGCDAEPQEHTLRLRSHGKSQSCSAAPL